MKLALQLYSVREDMEKDFFDTLERVRKMGYEGCEFAGLYGKTPSEISAKCKELGITPISAHVTYNELVERLEEAVLDYKEIGCKYIVVPYLPEELRYGTEKYPDVVENIKKIAGICNKHGITLLYHNHDFEFEKAETGEFVLDLLYKEVTEDLLKTEIDTCWVSVAGVNPCDYIRQYTNRAPVVHLKDYFGQRSKNMYELIGIESEKTEQKNTFEFRPLGKGVQNFVEILKAANDAGAEWVVAEQDSPSMGLTPMESAKISIDYIKNLL